MEALKEKTIIPTKEFMSNFSLLAKSPKSKCYIIVSHGKPIGVFLPKFISDDDAWWESLEQTSSLTNKPQKHLTLEEFRKKHTFHSGVKNLSQKVDEIVYGVKF